MDRVVDKNEDACVVVSWSDMVVPPGVIALPVKTEILAVSLKSEFLRWVHDFGKTKVDGQSLVSHLKIFDNLSFWWLTSVAEKSPLLCRSIFQVFKLRTLERIFSDNNNKMNCSVQDLNFELLVISQFTLYANCNKGNRPSFQDSEDPKEAEILYNLFVEYLKKLKNDVKTGKFGAIMDIQLNNQGPVTIMLESK